MYDTDSNGTLEFGEIVMYIKEMSPNLKLSDDQLQQIFRQIDVNNSGEIDKKEME